MACQRHEWVDMCKKGVARQLVEHDLGPEEGSTGPETLKWMLAGKRIKMLEKKLVQTHYSRRIISL
mgnify:CR=1 FL=1